MNLIKIILIYIFLLSCSGIVNAQILDNRKGEIFSDETFFSEEFIQKNRIKKISGRIRTKRVNEIIKDDRQVEMYTFNQGGLQTGYLKTYNAKGKKKDTSFIFYNYNDGRITMKRGNDRQGFFSHSYRRDDVGNIISEEYRREENTTADKSNYIPGKEYVIYTEKRSVESASKTHTKIKYFNSYDKPYKETTTIYNENGYLTEENTKYLIGRNKSSIKFEYNERGFLNKREEKDSYSEGTGIRYEYTFDEHGNILSENIFRNDQHTVRKEILYTGNMLIKALLIKDIETNDLIIIEYTCTFFGA